MNNIFTKKNNFAYYFFNFLFFFLLPQIIHSQSFILRGEVLDAKTGQKIMGASVRTSVGKSHLAVSDERGLFFMQIDSPKDSIEISAIGFQKAYFAVSDVSTTVQFKLNAQEALLETVEITGYNPNIFETITKLDLKMRPINNSQEVLRSVPGLFIGQHAGGGKAEQIFLRGFDLDHGTDISLAVDGMPVNMVSHAHGQGYADLHFLIPELIDNVNFKKGTYAAEKGNLTTAGFVDFKTRNKIDHNSVKLEAGQFNSVRGVGLFNILPKQLINKGHNAFIASEYNYTQGYFENPQDFRRFNIFAKYNGHITPNTFLNISASTFSSRWLASGQIPNRTVAQGLIGFYGAIDPNEGGNTSRSNINVQFLTDLKRKNTVSAFLKNQFWYAKYDFLLYSNFTFFKEDSINGDQIRQKENRHLFGYNGSYEQTKMLGKRSLTSVIGANMRTDLVNDIELTHTKQRSENITPFALGDIKEFNIGVYTSQTLQIDDKWRINLALRYDLIHSFYRNRLAADSIGTAQAAILSPKCNIYYEANKKTTVYITTGRGFHSNDTRVVVPQNGKEILPPAYGADWGLIWKPNKHLFINTALWYLYLQQEFVYVGDEAVIEPSGKSQRIGYDLSVRYQPLSALYLDFDINYAHPRSLDASKGENYLPLAPILTSVGGVTYRHKSGVNANIRYRFMGNRPANEDYTTTAKGYFVADCVVNYTKKKHEIALSIQNLFNTKWKETQFDTESRLANETTPVAEIHFTAGTPFQSRISWTYYF